MNQSHILKLLIFFRIFIISSNDVYGNLVFDSGYVYIEAPDTIVKGEVYKAQAFLHNVHGEVRSFFGCGRLEDGFWDQNNVIENGVLKVNCPELIVKDNVAYIQFVPSNTGDIEFNCVFIQILNENLIKTYSYKIQLYVNS